MAKATLLYLQNNINQAFDIFKDVHKLWQKNSQFIKTHCEHYLELLYMINYAGILKKEYNYILSAFNATLNNQIEDPIHKANFEAIKYVAFNRVYNKTADYEEVHKLIRHMQEKYKHWEPHLNSDVNRTVTLSLGIASFVLENYDDAIFFLKNGLHYYRDGTREEHTAVCFLLLLLTTYSLNNVRLFDAQYRATYAYFYKRKKKHPGEVALAQCLNHVFYMRDKQQIQKELNKALALIEGLPPTQLLFNTISIFNYPGWITSQLQGISYRQYVTRIVKTQQAWEAPKQVLPVANSRQIK